MKLVLVRHGDALSDAPAGLDDDARSLTAEARRALPAHFAALADRFGPVSLVLTSPLVRAVQTATLLAQALDHRGPLLAHRALVPGVPPHALEALVQEANVETLVLVGHQPTLGAAAGHFLGSSFSRPVSPGTAVGIDWRPGRPSQHRLLFYAQVGQPIVAGTS